MIKQQVLDCNASFHHHTDPEEVIFAIYVVTSKHSHHYDISRVTDNTQITSNKISWKGINIAQLYMLLAANLYNFDRQSINIPRQRT